MPDNLWDLRVIDSHTGGEPTRVITGGFPPLGNGSMAERLARFRSDFDHLRSAAVCEPRGSDAVVGALLCEPADAANHAGVLFFNNVGYLGMCGHGTIGLVETLRFLGRATPGVIRIETPVGLVQAKLHDDGAVTVANVPSFRFRKRVPVEVDGYGTLSGDIAWGGNWFFLLPDCPVELHLRNLDELTALAWNLRATLRARGITGAEGAEIDHVELFGPPSSPHADSRNFVLCPGKAYDRSPCGTGTSAKLACLYEDGKLQPGQLWRQESIIGSIFEGSIRVESGWVHPSIKGRAHITAEAHLLLRPDDPFQWGIRP